MSRTVDELLEAARARIRRWSAEEAWRLVARGGLLVDVRPEAQRRAHGEVPEATVVERNVLEWRLDPASVARLDGIEGYVRPLIVLCQEGYASSFAADSLRELGHVVVGDVIGGFVAWADAGLPIRRVR